MIEQQGKVIHVQDDSASVRIGAVAGCPACDAGKGCGAGVFGKLLSRQPSTVILENEVEAQPGQLVSIGIPEGVYLRLLFTLYLFPLVLGLAGAGIGHYLGVRMAVTAGLVDGLTLLAAILCGGTALWSVRYKYPRLPERVNVRLLRVITGADSVSCLPDLVDENQLSA